MRPKTARHPLLLRLAFPAVAGAAALLLIGAGAQTKTERDALRMLGVCSYDSSKLSCWTPAGRRDDELTRRLDRNLRRGEYSFKYSFARKNRVLVFEQSSKGYLNFSGATDSYLSSFGTRGDDLGPSQILVPISVDPERKVGAIFATAQTNEPAGSASSALKEGTEVKLGPVQVLVGLPMIASNQSYDSSRTPSTPLPRRRWNYPLAISSPPGTFVQLEAIALDTEGEIIVNVDADGRPIPLPPPVPDQNRSGSPPLYVTNNESVSKGLLSTTIDPKFVREIRWSATLNRRYEFRDFALDPRS